MILVTGATGQLGKDVTSRLGELSISYIGINSQLDITSKDITNFILEKKPTAIIHCAAYTAVDEAESESIMCKNVNTLGTENIVQACKKIKAKLIYISTDYVFNGNGETPFLPTDLKKPKNVYGKTKYKGEICVTENLEKYFIVRISWVFGKHGNNFVKTMLRLGSEKDELNIVCDQIGSPTYTKDVAILLCEMINTEKYGIYHATNEGFCSWAEFAKMIMQKAGLKCKINPILTKDYPTIAKRPLNSRLDKSILIENGFDLLPTWENALERYLEDNE